MRAAERRAARRGLEQVRLEGFDRHAGCLRFSRRKILSIHFRLDGPRLSLRRFTGQDLRLAPPRLTRRSGSALVILSRAAAKRGWTKKLNRSIGPGPKLRSTRRKSNTP